MVDGVGRRVIGGIFMAVGEWLEVLALQNSFLSLEAVRYGRYGR